MKREQFKKEAIKRWKESVKAAWLEQDDNKKQDLEKIAIANYKLVNYLKKNPQSF